MPEDFDRCQQQGGRIRTMVPKKGTTLPVCFDKSGKSHAGYPHKKKKVQESGKLREAMTKG